jgi:hypothetical protein
MSELSARRERFEEWYAGRETPESRRRLLSTNVDGHYKLMKVYLAFNAFLAGCKSEFRGALK